MSKLGWSYPAGCDGPPDGDTRCEVCCFEAGSCICPVCPVCGVQGDLMCFVEHGQAYPQGRLVPLTTYDPETGEAFTDYVPESALPYPSDRCPGCGAKSNEPGCEACRYQPKETNR
jgi:hypothetical protein